MSELADGEDSYIAVCSRDGKHRVVVGEVDGVDFSWQVVDRTKWFIVVAFVE